MAEKIVGTLLMLVTLFITIYSTLYVKSIFVPILLCPIPICLFYCTWFDKKTNS